MAIVTGGALGIGGAVARRLASEGARVRFQRATETPFNVVLEARK